VKGLLGGSLGQVANALDASYVEPTVGRADLEPGCGGRYGRGGPFVEAQAREGVARSQPRIDLCDRRRAAVFRVQAVSSQHENAWVQHHFAEADRRLAPACVGVSSTLKRLIDLPIASRVSAGENGLASSSREISVLR